jgi:hypothetical protein
MPQLTPEEFYAKHVDTDLSGFVTVDTLIKALGEYRDHFLKYLIQEQLYNAVIREIARQPVGVIDRPQGFHDGAVPPIVKDELQHQYDGFANTSYRKEMHNGNLYRLSI